jgi:membrane protein required for beta-lactamase induction
MMLLAIVLVLVGLRVLDFTPPERNATQSYVAQLRGIVRNERFWSSPVGPWVVTLLPVTAVAIVDAYLPWFLHLLLSIAILWLTLGPRELATDLRAWLSAHKRGDTTESQLRARAIWGEAPPSLGGLFVESHERLFGVLLWFFVLGPAGGVLYRVGRRMPQAWPGDAKHARELHALIAYLPARLTAMLFGAAGSADDVIAEWRHRRTRFENWIDRTWHSLSEVAAATLDVEDVPGGEPRPPTLEDGAEEFLQLEFRALLILLALFAVFTVGSWFG